MFKYIIKKNIFLIVFSFVLYNLYPSIVLRTPSDLDIPSRMSFDVNDQFIKPFKLKRLTVAEYLTDPLIMYASLWGCFSVTLPLWERNGEVWEPDGRRGFDKIYDNPYYNDVLKMVVDDTFGDRLKFEPFASGRIDPITKEYNGSTVLRGDFYAKNIVEPLYFTYLVLYMRAKNYHPAIMVTEIILLSLLYELTIRPFYMNASFEQFLKNPGISIAVGILLDELSNFLLSTPYIGLHILAYFINPFNALPNSRIHPMLFFDPFRKHVAIEAIIEF